jgi:protein SCO1/2
VLGLTGSPEQVAKAAKAYHVFYQRGAGSDEAYAMDHSTITYLMNPKGRFACVIPYGATPDEIARKVEAGMRNGAGAESC